MCHIIDEIVLNLCIALLSEYDDDGEGEGDKKHQGKDDAWYHELHTTEDIAIHVREVNFHNTHF